MTSPNLKEDLLLAAANSRHGNVLRSQTVQTGMSDIESIWNVGVPQNTTEPWKSASGGVGRDVRRAQLAAVGEALERLAAVSVELPKRIWAELEGKSRLLPEEFSLFREDLRSQPDFPFAALYRDDAVFTKVYSIYDNSEHWVPHGLVTLRDDYNTGVSTSSGLAAGSSRPGALLRAVQELIERDALMVTWLHGVPGRRVEVPGRYAAEVGSKGGEIAVIDATPAYSPHPVAIVAGSLPIRGRQRYSLGAACRETWEEAVEKAYLEWSQGVFFTAYYYSIHPDLKFESYDGVNSFDDHAVYYTVYPEQWAKVPLMQGERYERAGRETKSPSNIVALEKLVASLKKAGVRLFYRDITTSDLRCMGVYAARAISPDLAPIFSHQRYPHLGGRVKDVLWRYP